MEALRKPHSPRSDVPFYAGMVALGGMYLLLVVALVGADFGFVAFRMSFARVREIFGDPAVRASISLTLITCTLSAFLSLMVAIPVGYLMSRTRFLGKGLVDAVLDIPIVLPPLVIGLSLLILFNQFGLENLFHGIFQPLMPEGMKAGVTYKVPAVVLAQFTVACAFAVRTMRVTFDEIDPRTEHVALTLGCNRAQAFWVVVLPQAWRGALAAFGLAWARSMGEFGPILVFAGSMEYRTEVLSSTVFLDISVGNVEGAVTVSLLMVTIAILAIMVIRMDWRRAGGVWRRMSGR